MLDILKASLIESEKEAESKIHEWDSLSNDERSKKLIDSEALNIIDKILRNEKTEAAKMIRDWHWIGTYPNAMIDKVTRYFLEIFGATPTKVLEDEEEEFSKSVDNLVDDLNGMLMHAIPLGITFYEDGSKSYLFNVGYSLEVSDEVADKIKISEDYWGFSKIVKTGHRFVGALIDKALEYLE